MSPVNPSFTRNSGESFTASRHLSIENSLGYDSPKRNKYSIPNGNGNSLSREGYDELLLYSRHDNVNSNGDTSDLDKLEVTDSVSAADKKVCGFFVNKKIRMTLYLITYFLSGVAFSLPAPFFPQLASKKGMSLTLVGFVFSVYELTIFITSPIFGAYLTSIGPMFAYTAGITTAGACSILFGTLNMCPPGVSFFILSIAIRTTGAIGFSSFLTAVMAIASMEFPDNVATTMSFLEGSFGIGMMLGPTIGGVLYVAGGFGLPFYVLGAIVIVEGLGAYLVIPTLKTCVRPKRSMSPFSAFRSPLVFIASLSTVFGSFGTGFMDPSLAQHLEPFGLSVILISLFFVISPLAYTVTSPLYGYLSDKKGIYKELIVIGQLVYGIGFLLIGPSEQIPFLPNKLWTVTVGLLVQGLTMGCTITPPFKCFLVGLMDVGFEDNMETYGLMSGLATSMFCLGGFLGPMIGGVLVQELGERFAFTIVGLSNIATSILSVVVFIVQGSRKKKYYERIPLISGLEGENNSDDDSSV